MSKKHRHGIAGLARGQRRPAPLTNDEWTRLRTPSGLPDVARHAVQNVVDFLQGVPSTQHPFVSDWHEARDAVAETESALETAHAALSRFVAGGAYNYVHLPLPDSRAEPGAVSATAVVMSKDEPTKVRNSIADLLATL